MPSTTLLTDPYAITTARWLIGLIFLLSSITKLRDPKGFTMAVYNFRVMPAPLADLYAALIPYVEMVTGALLLVGLFTQMAAAAAFLTLLSFTLAIGWNLARGHHPDCHCFGNLFSEELSSMLVIRNTALMAIVSVAIFTPSVFLALDPLWGFAPAAVTDFPLTQCHSLPALGLDRRSGRSAGRPGQRNHQPQPLGRKPLALVYPQSFIPAPFGSPTVDAHVFTLDH